MGAIYFMKLFHATSNGIAGSNKTAGGWRALALAALLCVAPSLQAKLYVYIGPDGTRWITDTPNNAQDHTLIREYQGPREVVACSPESLRKAKQAGQGEYDRLIGHFARSYELEPALIRAVIHVESCYNPRAKSRAGAIGLMQLMPGTAKRFGVKDIYDPMQNMRGGVRYLKLLLGLFKDNLKLALAAYNAGENAVKRYGGVPPYQETRTYITRVMRQYEQYKYNN